MSRPGTLGAMARATAIGLLMIGMSAAAARAAGGGGDAASPGRAEDPEMTAAVRAIKASDLATARRLLEGVVARDGGNADAYNWLGYAIRLGGDPARALPAYEKALALDPRHRGAHEYIGEAYLALDNLPKAKEHLARLNSLCWLPCEEYRDLKKAVADYEGSGGKIKPAGR